MHFDKKKKSSLAKMLLGFSSAVLILFTFIMFYSFYWETKKQNTIEKNIIVQAEYVKIGYTVYRAIEYFGRYEFVDENSVKYEGEDRSWLTTDEAKAESYRGQKVDIYIDGKGHSVIVGTVTHAGRDLAIAIPLLILTLIDALILFLPWRTKAKKNASN